MEIIIKSLKELSDEAFRFVGSVTPQEHCATLVTLSGELGAGKTAFTKAVAHFLCVEETVTSPTFVLEKIYKLGSETPKFKRLIHIDAYRLDSDKDLASIGFDEIMKDRENLILFEWPEKVSSVLPKPFVHISFTLNEDGSRTITYD